MDIGRKLQQLENRLAAVERSPRLSHAALDNASIVVKDDAGMVRGRIGMQPDGTLGLVAQDGPPPGVPTAPVVTASMGGLRVVWDGMLADGSPLPADFDHVAVHISTESGFTPSAATYVGTITKAGDGGMLPVLPLPYQPHYVRLAAVNSSGVAGDPSEQTTATPIQVDGPDLKAGSVTAATIDAGAVTAEKLEAVLQLVTRLVAGDPAGARVELNENGLRVYNSTGELVIRFDAADGSAVFTGTITGSTVTGGLIRTATSGERITLNEAGQNKITVYNAAGVAIAEVSPRGMLVAGTNGSTVWLDPNNPLPQIRFDNASGTASARLQMAEVNPGDANLQFLTGYFPADGFTDRIWRQYMGNDFAVIERVRWTSSVNHRGGRLNLRPDFAEVGYMSYSTPTDAGYSLYQPGVVTTKGRHQVQPPPSATPALHVDADTAHTGPLARASRNNVDYFTVDRDGNTDIGGILTAGNVTAGNVTITAGSGTPTSVNVGGLDLKGAVHVVATPSTSVPGTQVTGVGVTNVTKTGFTVWLTRTGTATATRVNWMAFGI
ncbi:MAG TPA: hypothetical protein VFY14_14010 [Streptomyces sp.]|nr:hypothetical protein [Streptomyces sp.]